MSWTLFFSKPKCSDYSMTNFLFFGWSQGSGYSVRVSKGSLYRVSPDKIPPKCLGWSNLWLTWMFSLIKKTKQKICSSCIKGGALFKNIYKFHFFFFFCWWCSELLRGIIHQIIVTQSFCIFFYWSKSSLVYVIFCPIFPPFSLQGNVQS